MNATKIYNWLKTLPDELLFEFSYGGRVAGPALVRSLGSEYAEHPDTLRYALVYSMADFGWHFTRVLAKYGLPFPFALEGEEEILYRAYLFHCNEIVYNDQSMMEALSLLTGDMMAQRAALESLLLCEEADIEATAMHMNMKPRVIRTYEKLFFNVRDRLRDARYIMSIVYPRGRVVELLSGYVQNSPLRQLMHRSGYNNGPDDVMYLAGVSNNLVTNMAAAQSTSALEGMIMSHGYMMARNGMLNQVEDAQGLVQAGRLLAAGKVGGEDTSGQSEMNNYWSVTFTEELEKYAGRQLESVSLELQEQSILANSEEVLED